MVTDDALNQSTQTFCCADVSLTTDGELFQTVRAEMQKARAAVAVLVDGAGSRT